MRKAASSAAVGNKALWQEAADRLLARFTQRAPAMKDVVLAFRRVPDDDEHALQREAVTCLLRLYYEVTPVQALEEQVDVSTALAAALTWSEGEAEVSGLIALRALELEHILVVAQHSTGMRWSGKSSGLQYSPIISLLRLHMKDLQNRKIRSLIGQVLEQHGLLVDNAGVDAPLRSTGELTELEALVASLTSSNGEDSETWAFIDDCVARASRQPVKYADQIDAAAAEPHNGGFGCSTALPGLLAAAVAEQAHFVAKKPGVMGFVDKFHGLLSYGTLPSRVAVLVYENVRGLAGRSELEDYDENALIKKTRLVKPQGTNSSGTQIIEKPSLPFIAPPPESDNHPELLRWAQKDLASALEDGDINALILCLCSQHPEIRRQALSQLRILFAKLQASTLEDKGHLSVLIGSLTETFEQQCLQLEDKPLPYLTATFAARALHVLMEPAHFMYPKLNRFIMRSPEWRITRLPSYWLSNTTLSQPEEDDAYWKEVLWVIEWLVDGLRLISCGEGMTGVLEWLGMVEGKIEMAGLVRERVLGSCDGIKVARWSGVGVETL
ncbi:hypothetical protein B0A55_04813 [Friedmanniomyces simplex]|uniref:Uncharacterized protein n=1 Tax=Friedmanniomyces simplex TaxID=329884 RepID=A0A4V5NIM7_9PEZI|nr:hypothetical protein B0A55_04813 [Friedmanniomyces simplex]